MKKIFTLLFVLYCLHSESQDNVPLEYIWNGNLRPKSIQLVEPMKDAKYYSSMTKESDIYMINKYSYVTSEKIETIFSTEDYPEVKNIFKYSFNDDETKLLIASNYTKNYRHSFWADYHIIDLETKHIHKIDSEPVQQATLSPNGKFVSYMKNNNLFIQNLSTKEITRITDDGEKNKIINGISDWVYEEEFSLVKMFCWNKNSDQILYVKFDESEVPEISMDIFDDKLYTSQLKFKYPKAGEKNSDVSLHYYNLNSKKTEKIDLNRKDDFYIPRIFPYDNDGFAFMLMNREQNELDIFSFEDNKLKKIYFENSDTYIEVPIIEFLEDDSFIISSEKDGFNHLYHYRENNEINQITKGNWEVIKFYGYDINAQIVYFQSNISGINNTSINSIKINGDGFEYLSIKEGSNNAYFNSDFSLFIKVFSNDNTPNRYTLEKVNNLETVKTIEDNRDLDEKIKSFNLPKKEFFDIKLDNDISLNAYMLKPNNFDKNKKYPLFIHLYGGPGSQRVSDKYSLGIDLWLKHIANKGYIVVVLDPRGTGGKGEKFKKITYKNLGHFEIVDLINSAKKLSKESYIDENRIGVFGWSFGGYMTSLAMTKGSEIFSLGIAVAPVINWRFYDSIYTERYLSTPQKNERGYEDNSPINFADKLRGKYLLIHGSADDNVHYQNSMIMAKKLVEMNKSFDFFVYPDKDHGIGGGKSREHLFIKMTDYIENNL